MNYVQGEIDYYSGYEAYIEEDGYYYENPIYEYRDGPSDEEYYYEDYYYDDYYYEDNYYEEVSQEYYEIPQEWSDTW